MPLRNQPLHLNLQTTRNWVEDVLTFANLENADDIPRKFGADAQRDWVDPDDSSSIDVLYNFIGGLGRDGFHDSQATLREVLKTLTEPDGPSKVDQLISDRVDSVRVDGTVTFTAGYLRFQSIGQFQSQDQWWAIGIGRLIHADLADRVRQCRKDECATFFVDWPGRQGKPRYYCSDDHQNVDRQQRHRDREKRKRELQKANQSMGY